MSWKKIAWVVVFALFLAGFGYIYAKKLSQLSDIRRRQQECQESVNELEGRASYLAREREELNTNGGIEKLGRNKLGLARKNEMIFIIEPTPSPPGSGAASPNRP